MSRTYKEDWDYEDVIEANDINRIEGNIKDVDEELQTAKNNINSHTNTLTQHGESIAEQGQLIEALKLKEIVVLTATCTPPASPPVTTGWQFDYPEGFNQNNTVLISAGFQRDHSRDFVRYGYTENPDTAIGEYRTKVLLTEEKIEWWVKHTGYTNKYLIRLAIARFE